MRSLNWPLVLASASPRRRILLKSLRMPFVVRPSRIPERSRFRDPRQFVQDLALQKATAVAKGMSEGLVLGADTVVVLRGKILGKPKDARDAYRMLYGLAGSRHRVVTGVALVDAKSGKALRASETSIVRMRKLDLSTLLRLSKRHLDKAGAYAIQSRRDPIATVVKGAYDNVVGLPVALVGRLIRRMGGGKKRS